MRESSHGHMYVHLSCTLARRGSHPHPPRPVIDPFRSFLPSFVPAATSCRLPAASLLAHFRAPLARVPASYAPSAGLNDACRRLAGQVAEVMLETMAKYRRETGQVRRAVRGVRRAEGRVVSSRIPARGTIRSDTGDNSLRHGGQFRHGGQLEGIPTRSRARRAAPPVTA